MFIRHRKDFSDPSYSPPMPWGLKRYQQARDLHFITFSRYHRAPLLDRHQVARRFSGGFQAVTALVHPGAERRRKSSPDGR